VTECTTGSGENPTGDWCFFWYLSHFKQEVSTIYHIKFGKSWESRKVGMQPTKHGGFLQLKLGCKMLTAQTYSHLTNQNDDFTDVDPTSQTLVIKPTKK
jgi:hypothetical protein